MKEKIQKIISNFKKDGFTVTVRKIYKYSKAKYFSKINIFSYLYIKIHYKKYNKMIDDILNEDFDRIIIWRSTFGWNVPLFQRPQHISVNLADKRNLVFYEITTMTDKVSNIKKVKNNLYLVNFNNIAIKKLILSKIKNIDKPKYIQIYSTDCNMPIENLKDYIKDGFKIIYEYIDDLCPELVGTKVLPKNQLDKYNYMLEDTDNVYVVVTATELEKDVVSKRGNKNLVFSCNGVDVNHFKNIDKDFEFDENYKKILEQKKPIIGYYGALASWFDYDMIKYLAKKRKEYNIVLFGIEYDESYKLAKLSEYKNIYFLGCKEYNILQNYAGKFDVCTIPFLINDITKATSPVKLFEYMALEKPIVTTEMDECKKYKSVITVKNKEEFVEYIDYALKLNSDKNSEYFETMKKEAKENSWDKKAEKIIELLIKNE